MMQFAAELQHLENNTDAPVQWITETSEYYEKWRHLFKHWNQGKLMNILYISQFFLKKESQS